MRLYRQGGEEGKEDDHAPSDTGEQYVFQSVCILPMMISVTAADYALFKSFRTGFVITLVTLWVTMFAVRAIGSLASLLPFGGSGFAYYPYAMSVFTFVLVVRWMVVSRSKLERAFFLVWILVLAVGCLQAWSSPKALLTCQRISALLLSTSVVFALLITIDLARPLYREARLQRIAREQSKVANQN